MNINRMLRVPPGTSLKKLPGPNSISCTPPATKPGRPENLISLSKPAPTEGAWSPCSNCSSDDNNSPTALNSFHWSKPALEDKSVNFECTSPLNAPTLQAASSSTVQANTSSGNKRPLSNGYVNVRSNCDERNGEESAAQEDAANETSAIPKNVISVQDERRLRIECTKHSNPPTTDSACSPCEELLESPDDFDFGSDRRTPTNSPPGSPLGSNAALNQSNEISRAQKEQEELRDSAWFQAGIPREIALEVLSGKPVGSFIVRESTTKPGCYALSLRTPPEHNSLSGIAHYLILHTPRGYKIKGFTKEFSTLSSLITHHSVMQELLPCPLALPRYNNDRKSSDRDSDLDYVRADQRCSLFSDIHWFMTDLEL